MTRVAVVTGSNKGIGYEIVKKLLQKFDGVVYLTSRNEARGKAALASLNKLGLHPEFHLLDVSDRDSVLRFRDHIKAKHGGFDILINNAGVVNTDSWYVGYEESKETIDINYYSLLTVEELLYPLLREGARVVNVSSDCGHLSNVKNEYWIKRLSQKDLTKDDINEFINWFLDGVKKGTFNYDEIADKGTAAAYRVAKVGMCALTILQQKELAKRNIIINSMHPGLVATDMTSGKGDLTASEAADTPIWLALDAPADLRGAYVWFDRRVLDWYDHTKDYYFKSAALEALK